MIPDRSGIGFGSGTRLESGLVLGYRVGDSMLMLLLLSKLSKSEKGELVKRLCKRKIGKIRSHVVIEKAVPFVECRQRLGQRCGTQLPFAVFDL